MKKVVVEFPKELIEEIERIVGVGNAPAFLVETAQNYLKRQRPIKEDSEKSEP